MSHMSRSTTDLAQNVSKATAKLARNNSSLFTNPNAPLKRPSLFSRPSQLSQNSSNSLTRPALNSSVSPRNYISNDSDTDDDNEPEEVGSNGSKISYKDRISSSTSIVRGFAPSSVSIAAVTRPNKSSVSFASSAELLGEPSSSSSSPPPISVAKAAVEVLLKIRPLLLRRERLE